MSLFPGALIRRQRMRQNWSQEGLCSGICAVSYLSKIEQGKVQAGEDILLPLLERLGIRYETDPDFLARAGALIDRLYEDVYDGLSLLDSAPVEGRLAEPPPICWTCCCWRASSSGGPRTPPWGNSSPA